MYYAFLLFRLNLTPNKTKRASISARKVNHYSFRYECGANGMICSRFGWTQFAVLEGLRPLMRVISISISFSLILIFASCPPRTGRFRHRGRTAGQAAPLLTKSRSHISDTRLSQMRVRCTRLQMSQRCARPNTSEAFGAVVIRLEQNTSGSLVGFLVNIISGPVGWFSPFCRLKCT